LANGALKRSFGFCSSAGTGAAALGAGGVDAAWLAAGVGGVAAGAAAGEGTVVVPGMIGNGFMGRMD
jgi:hypothetical protein